MGGRGEVGHPHCREGPLLTERTTCIEIGRERERERYQSCVASEQSANTETQTDALQSQPNSIRISSLSILLPVSPPPCC